MSDSAYLIDTNVWIALAFASHSHRRQAIEAYARANQEQPAVFCRSTQQSFLRLATTPVVLKAYGAEGFTNEDALDALNQFLSLPAVSYREEPPGLVSLWHRLAGRSTALPHIWMDAYLAAFAIAANITMVTFDRDFKAFEKEGLELLFLETPNR